MLSVLPRELNVSTSQWRSTSLKTPKVVALWLQILWTLAIWSTCAVCMTKDQIASLRQETRDIFYHGYDNYIEHAFPEDELRPVTCTPLTRDRQNPGHIELNDALGNYSLTLIDSLSTLAILASAPLEIDATSKSRELAGKSLSDFQDGIKLLVETYGDGTSGQSGVGTRARGFDVDSKVQVFETVIRGVGGLLSAHLFATGDLPIRGYHPAVRTKRDKTGLFWRNGLVYDGQLLRLAKDLADRLLPAFHTVTGLPYPRVNLRTGVPFYINSPLNSNAETGQCPPTPSKDAEITETCSAGAGSLVLEFTTLSRLTNDIKYEIAAKRAFWSVWERRASTGLVGAGVDAESGQWIGSVTGIGAGIDSFFEYAFKSHVLLSGLPYDTANPKLHSPDRFLEAWHDSQQAIKRHVHRGAIFQHPHYVQVDIFTGALRAFWIDSLSAFYPGLLASAGELEEAISTHLLYTALWTRYSALPERWSTMTGNIESGLRWWGGRPEFIESTWYIYRATQDPWYLYIGEMVLRDIKRRCWTRCGWAGLQDVRTGEKMDRMESFFLGETAKYMYLLFDPDHPLNHLDANFVFTTEGHPLIIPKRFHDSTVLSSPEGSSGLAASTVHDDTISKSAPVCPMPPSALPLTVSYTAARGDVWHAANLARIHQMPNIQTLDSPLIEFSADHPSISLSDLKSPSNYTYYPWTLPPEFVSPTAMSSKPAARTTFDLSFPISPESASLNTLQRVVDGIWVHSMSGLRLGMIKEPMSSNTFLEESIIPPVRLNDDLFRIYAVSNVGLGRDEKVFLSKDLVSDFNPIDPYFTRIRDTRVLDLVIDASPPPVATIEPTCNTSGVSSPSPLIIPPQIAGMVGSPEQSSLLSSLLHNIQSMFVDTNPLSSRAPAPTAEPSTIRHRLSAAPPSGPGNAPLADVDEPAPIEGTNIPQDLPWRTIHVHEGDLCKDVISADIVKHNQILVIKRGGCSFSDKLRNIPSFIPDAHNLQLVVVVSGFKGPEAQEGLISPLLDQVQMTPGGIVRPHPISMIMVDGGEETMELLKRARGVGIRRKWWFESQGVKISNLIVV